MGNISKKQRAQEEALALRAEDKTIKEIAEATGLSEMEVVDTIAEAGKTIKSLQAIQVEAAVAHTGNTRQQRLSRLSAMRDSILAEIQERGLKEVPTDKLLTILLRTEEALERNTVQPTIYSSHAWETVTDREEI